METLEKTRKVNLFNQGLAWGRLISFGIILLLLVIWPFGFEGGVV